MKLFVKIFKKIILYTPHFPQFSTEIESETIK